MFVGADGDQNERSIRSVDMLCNSCLVAGKDVLILKPVVSKSLGVFNLYQKPSNSAEFNFVRCFIFWLVEMHPFSELSVKMVQTGPYKCKKIVGFLLLNTNYNQRLYLKMHLYICVSRFNY